MNFPNNSDIHETDLIHLGYIELFYTYPDNSIIPTDSNLEMLASNYLERTDCSFIGYLLDGKKEMYMSIIIYDFHFRGYMSCSYGQSINYEYTIPELIIGFFA